MRPQPPGRVAPLVAYIQTDDVHAFSSTPLGFIFYAGGGQRIYHTGDTAIFSDLKLIGDLYQPTEGLIKVGVPHEHRGAAYLTGEMDAR